MWFFLDILHDLPEIILKQIVEILLLFGLRFQFLRHEEDLIVDLCISISTGLDFSIEAGNFFGDVLVHRPPDPPHLVLVDFLYVSDPLQHVCDVVYSSLLDS